MIFSFPACGLRLTPCLLYTSKNEKEVPEIAMGYLPQYNCIDKKFPISVYEVVLSGLNKQKSLFHRYTPEQHELVSRIIARMGLEGLESRAIGELSGGQLQRALLGRALVSNPEVVILDEPNTYIDKRFEAKLYSLLEEMCIRDRCGAVCTRTGCLDGFLRLYPYFGKCHIHCIGHDACQYM